MNPIVKLATGIVRVAIKNALVKQGVPENAAAQLADLPAVGFEVGYAVATGEERNVREVIEKLRTEANEAADALLDWKFPHDPARAA